MGLGFIGPHVGGTHYLMADHHLGPWRVAPGPFLDGSDPVRRYAGKIVQHQGDLLFMGFMHDTLDGNFVGQITDPINVSVDPLGQLSLT